MNPEKMNVEVTDSSFYNPSKNKDVICLVKQVDGNWKLWAQKFGKLIEVREISPMACVEKFLVYNGK